MSEPRHIYLLGNLPKRFERWMTNGSYFVKVHLKPGEDTPWQDFCAGGQTPEEAERNACTLAFQCLSNDEEGPSQPSTCPGPTSWHPAYPGEMGIGVNPGWRPSRSPSNLDMNKRQAEAPRREQNAFPSWRESAPRMLPSSTVRDVDDEEVLRALRPAGPDLKPKKVIRKQRAAGPDREDTKRRLIPRDKGGSRGLLRRGSGGNDPKNGSLSPRQSGRQLILQDEDPGRRKILDASLKEVSTDKRTKKVEKYDDNSTAILNELGQKGVTVDPPKFSFKHSSASKVLTGNRWICTGMVLVPQGADEPKELKRTASARSKKDAKKFCAKELLEGLKKIGIGVGVSTANSFPAGENHDGSKEDPTPDNRNLIGQLDQLYRRGLLLTMPKYATSQTGEATGGTLWKCSLLVRPKNFKEFSISSSASQKKKAKNLSAEMALNKLFGMGMVEAERGYFRKKETMSDNDDDSVIDFNFAEDEIDEAIENLLVGAEDVDGNFKLRKSFKVFVAENEDHCDQWIARYVQHGEMLGTYIDSYDVRQSFKSIAQKNGIDVNVGDFQAEDCKTICFSTTKSAVLISSFAMRTAHGSCWIPKSVKEVLETSSYTKTGLFMDEGAMILYAVHGIKCAGLNDLNLASACARGVLVQEIQVLLSCTEMVREWLNVGFSPFQVKKSTWSTKIPAEFNLPAVLTANVCVRLRSKINEKADETHLKRFPKAKEYSELYNKLCNAKLPLSLQTAC